MSNYTVWLHDQCGGMAYITDSQHTYVRLRGHYPGNGSRIQWPYGAPVRCCTCGEELMLCFFKRARSVIVDEAHTGVRVASELRARAILAREVERGNLKTPCSS